MAAPRTPPPPPPSINPAVLPQPADNQSLAASDLRGEAFGSSETVTEAGIVLPNNPCRYVMLANWNTSAAVALPYTSLSANNLYEDSGEEIYYGFNGIYVAQLFPSQNTGLLPVNNTSKICVRTRAGVTRELFFAWFW